MGARTNTAAIALTFTLSEDASDFAFADIAVSGCNLGSLSGSGSSYSATCTASSSSAVTINIAADGFTDSVGNGNTVATQYDWTYDGTAPTITTVAVAGATEDGYGVASTYVVTITPSETLGAVPTLTVTGGSITTAGALSGSDYVIHGHTVRRRRSDDCRRRNRWRH